MASFTWAKEATGPYNGITAELKMADGIRHYIVGLVAFWTGCWSQPLVSTAVSGRIAMALDGDSDWIGTPYCMTK